MSRSHIMSTYGIPDEAELNEPHVRRTLAHIRANPDTWDQRTYACGTTHCFAGWAYVLGRDRPWPVGPVGVERAAIGEAAHLLGFNAHQAYTVFHLTGADDADGEYRHPTFAELVHHVAAVTGMTFTPGVDYDPDDLKDTDQ